MASSDEHSQKNHLPFYYPATGEDESAAEAQLVANLEEKRHRVTTTWGQTYTAAVPGERPLLGTNFNLQNVYQVYHDDDKTKKIANDDDFDNDEEDDRSDEDTSQMQQPLPPTTSSRARLRHAVQKTMQQRRAQLIRSQSHGKHHRKKSDVQSLLEYIQEEDENNDSRPFAEEKPFSMQHQRTESSSSNLGIDLGKVDSSHTDRFVVGGLQVQSLFEKNDSDGDSTSSSLGSSIVTEEYPLLPISTSSPRSSRAWYSSRFSRKLYRKSHRRLIKYCQCTLFTIQFLWHAVITAYFCFAAIPLFILAWIFFYHLGNPHFEFLPGNTTMSWWLNFTGRQLLTLEMARMAQFFIIDGLTLRSKLVIQLTGPLVTLLAIQSRGWPFLLSAWSLIDLFMLHGDTKFPRNWFYWTGLEIYSSKVTGIYILNSDLYFRSLMCMLVVGSCVSVKRSMVAIYFGRKTFAEFKPKLERLLKEICLIAEIAELAEDIHEMAHDDLSLMGFGGSDNGMPRKRSEDSDDDATPIQRGRKATPQKRKGLSKVANVKWQKEDVSALSDDEGHGNNTEETEEVFARSPFDRTDSGSIRIKELLDRWEEPINKLDKSIAASISDVLQFRRALDLMDESHPFGEAFGEAAKRDDCIMSAHELYLKLMKLSPNEKELPFETLALIAQSPEDKEESHYKRGALLKLFRPDKNKKVPLLAFIQACDTLYRRLRYFRASVGNATVIDHVLEDVCDYLVAFVLFLVSLSILNFNPWPLLVSMSTLIVSFSFAVGNSASKYIEGILLIAVRRCVCVHNTPMDDVSSNSVLLMFVSRFSCSVFRPYDLGDRIIITGSEAPGSPGVANSWFVEDINLYYTTLRYAATNEVCTMANGTLSGSRIVNCHRSTGAIVVFNFPLHLCVLEGSKLSMFEQALVQYVDDHPRNWDCVLYTRIEDVDADKEMVSLRISVRHRCGWMEAGRILSDRGLLIKQIYDIGETLSIQYTGVPNLYVKYEGGTCREGRPGQEQYWRDIIEPANIVNKEQ
ncbi:hypothetical protein FisN_28Hh008 [Fistulifera solaris]|uniref:Uncharacterized protein n=1 Tax=Fistulifera solaris TaxID=1519565 RepID=A0A1Z5KGU1_FISSO|nr:hypothetical protein FisN_28Hh008 [Fistulifera solaris]|eukprot:GAX25540.1 hypothetical protein FisN_28Hh008 [Fistulifera solaris]